MADSINQPVVRSRPTDDIRLTASERNHPVRFSLPGAPAMGRGVEVVRRANEMPLARLFAQRDRPSITSGK